MAMELLQAGVDRAAIALWLGHESVETTQIYREANLALREAILAKTTPLDARPGRYRADDELLAFLNQRLYTNATRVANFPTNAAPHTPVINCCTKGTPGRYQLASNSRRFSESSPARSGGRSRTSAVGAGATRQNRRDRTRR